MANILKYVAKEPEQVQTGEAAASAAAAGKDDYSESADAFATATSAIAAALQQRKDSFDVRGVAAQMDSASINSKAGKAEKKSAGRKDDRRAKAPTEPYARPDAAAGSSSSSAMETVAAASEPKPSSARADDAEADEVRDN